MNYVNSHDNIGGRLTILMVLYIYTYSLSLSLSIIYILVPYPVVHTGTTMMAQVLLSLV